MIKKLLILICCLYGSLVYAKCPLGDAYVKAGKKRYALNEYMVCAEKSNDAESQFYVGMRYLNGTDGVEQSLQNAFLYFRMGAENGYAPAQRELAKLIDALQDMGDAGKSAWKAFEVQWQKDPEEEPMSALAWMILAAEKAENKWFYNAPAIADEEAVKLLPSFRKKEDAKKAEKQAVIFKQEKLMSEAKNLLSDSAYRDFETIIYPEKQNGKVRPRMSKTQAVENLRQYKMSIKK